MENDEQAATTGEPYSVDSARARARSLSTNREWAHRHGSQESRDRADAAYGRLIDRQGYDPLGPDARPADPPGRSVRGLDSVRL